jgi:2'-5' RNA ligase
LAETTVIRTFIAIEFPPEIQENIDQVSQDLRIELKGMPVRWVAAGNIHLTLKFLGDVSLSQVELIKKLLSNITKGHQAFKINVGGLGIFPKPQRPKVIWVGVDAPSDLIDIQNEIEKAVSQIGFPPETRPFSPHLTLGRITQPVNPILINRISECMESSRGVKLGSFEVKAIQLFRSDLKPGGSIYTRLFSGLLGNNNF